MQFPGRPTGWAGVVDPRQAIMPAIGSPRHAV